jgi:GntR family transcriptional repressor for pyruvate dehydrogenase complex
MEQLEDRIIDGDLAEGEKLPSEQELAEQAGVGRRAIREALKALEMKGLIEIRKGSGSFVIRNDFDSYIETLMRNVHAYLQLNKAKLKHLLQYRELLAGSIIGMLAEKPDPGVISQLESTVAAQREAHKLKSAARYNRAHLDFHFTIINSLDNPILTMMYTQVMKLLEPYMKKSGSSLEIMESAIREHAEILSAIKNGDASRAHQAVHSHLEGSFQHLEEII